MCILLFKMYFCNSEPETKLVYRNSSFWRFFRLISLIDKVIRVIFVILVLNNSNQIKKKHIFVKYVSFKILKNNERILIITQHIYPPLSYILCECLLIANVSTLIRPQVAFQQQSVFNILIQRWQKKWSSMNTINEHRLSMSHVPYNSDFAFV